MFEKGPAALLSFRCKNNSNKQRKDKVSKYVYLSLCVTQFLRSYFLNFSDVLSFPFGAYTCLPENKILLFQIIFDEKWVCVSEKKARSGLTNVSFNHRLA